MVHAYDDAGMPKLHRSSYRVPMESKQRNRVTAELEVRLGRPLTLSEQKLLILAETFIDQHNRDDSRPISAAQACY